MNSKRISRKVLVTLMAVLLTIAFCGMNPAESFAASKLKLSPASKTLTVGKTAVFKTNKSVKWSVVSGKKIVKITSKSSKKAAVKGLKAGKAVLQAKSGKTAVKAKITVKKAAALKSFTLKASCSHNSVGVKGACIVSVDQVSPAGAAAKVTYSSSDESVATVNPTSGLVTGVKEGTVTITATSTANKAVKASITLNVVKTQQGVVTTSINMTDATKYPKGKVIKVWVPVAHTTDNQKVKDAKIDAAKASVAKITTDSEGNKIAYIEWDKNTNPADRTAKVSFHACRKQVVRPELKESGKVDTKAMAKYLKATSKSGLDSTIVKNSAAEALKEAGNPTTVLGKTRAIYDWTVKNLVRKDSNETSVGKVLGCGDGDVVRILNEKQPGGHCTDINSVFISLLRSQGIPAREMFGIRMNGADITVGQHCRAQFYLPGTGWVEADPGDALKMIKTKANGDKSSPEAKAFIEQYWGGNNEQWVELSEGRDLTLNPAQEGPALNNFGYPYAEMDGEPLEYYNAKTFAYTISFAQDNDSDCC
jgi:transglutaminase-like putative cysteine protease